MILSHKHKFIFICNGKTGTTSIESKIGHLDESVHMNSSTGGLWVGKHMPPAVVRALLPKEVWDSYYKFVFVRHPFDWFVSQYRWNFKPPRFPFQHIWSEPLRAPNYIKHFLFERRIASRSMFHLDDVEMLAQKLTSYKGYPHTETRYQYSYVSGIEGEVIVDKIGKFETLEQDLQEIDSRIGNVIGKLPHLNQTKHKHYLDHLSPEAMEAIREIWKIDFEKLGYE